MDLTGKNVVVFGLAGSGRAAARLAVERGAHVVGIDQKTDCEPIPGVRLELGAHRADTFAAADLILVSPGIPATAAPLVAAAARGQTILGELAFAASCVDLPIVAITGTNGKSTVTWFTGQLLDAAGMRPFVGGNLGRPYSEAAWTENRAAYDCAVVEVSSYQMEWPSDAFRPRAAVIINLTPDHLARHGTMDVYGAMKCRVFQHMPREGVAFLPMGDAALTRLSDGVGVARRAWLGGVPGVVRDGALVAVQLPGGPTATFDLGEFSVPGEHNRDNAGLAAALALAMGASPDLIQAAICGLRALPHRMEVVAERDGVTWINDSKATNVAAARVGIGGLDRRGVVLLGGEAKGDRFAELAPLLSGWQVLCFGGSGAAIAEELQTVGVSVHRAGGLADAVARARGLAVAGQVVLLSPGCASFDEFRNFEHRGEVFRRLACGGAA